MITRDWIRSDAIIHVENDTGGINTYTKNDLCEFINYWKIKLTSLGAKRGDKIGFGMDNSEINLYAMIFAAFELGMQVVVLHVPNNEKECQAPRSNAHLPLDFFIYFSYYLGNPKLSTGIRHYKKNAKISIAYGNAEWQAAGEKFRTTEETPILAKPDDVCFCCTSSGTLDDPKLITYTHKYLFDLCSTNWRDLDYTDNDVIMHLSSLNHGGVITLLLSAFAVCKEHFFMTGLNPMAEVLPSFFGLCQKYNVTKIMCSSGGVIDAMIKAMKQDGIKLSNTTIMMLSFMSPKWVDAVKEEYLYRIDSIFGCSEIGGPVFKPSITKDTVDFNPKILGAPCAGFFKTKIIDGRIHSNDCIFDDIVVERPDGVHFISKNRLRKVNDTDINPLDVIELVEPHASRYSFEVFVDEIYNELVIITSDEILYELRDSIKTEVEAFYLGNVPVVIIYEPYLSDATISHKADRDKLSFIVERYRLTSQKNTV